MRMYAGSTYNTRSDEVHHTDNSVRSVSLSTIKAKRLILVYIVFNKGRWQNNVFYKQG
jgi:hypothetical protein